MTDDALMKRITNLDPVSDDPAPKAGSPRFLTTKDHVMAATAEHSPTPTTSPHTPLEGQAPSRRNRWLAGAAAAAVAVAAIGFALAGPGTTPSAEAQVRTAANGTAEITDFRMSIQTNRTDIFPDGTGELEVDGDNYRLSAGGFDLAQIRVGDVEVVVFDGEVVETNSDPVEFAPYGEASVAVINAALASGDVTEGGSETLNGVETTRYEIGIDAAAREALGALPTSVLEWFAQEVDEDVETIDGVETATRSGLLDDADTLELWIADDLIHQISVDSGSTQFTHTFYDFGIDITVALPE